MCNPVGKTALGMMASPILAQQGKPNPLGLTFTPFNSQTQTQEQPNPFFSNRTQTTASQQNQTSQGNSNNGMNRFSFRNVR